MVKGGVMDTEDLELKEMAKNAASELVDREIAHHPELIGQRETLLEGKSKQLEKEIKKKNEDLIQELNLASALVKEYLTTLPPDVINPYLEKLSTVQKSDDPNKTLQEQTGVPNDIMQLIYKYGMDLQKDQDFSSSSAIFKFLIVLNPLVADFWTALGYCQIMLEDPREALKSFRNSLLNDPDNLRAFYFFAYTHQLLNDHASALATVEEALKQTHNPKFAEWETAFKEMQLALKESKNQ